MLDNMLQNWILLIILYYYITFCTFYIFYPFLLPVLIYIVISFDRRVIQTYSKIHPYWALEQGIRITWSLHLSFILLGLITCMYNIFTSKLKGFRSLAQVYNVFLKWLLLKKLKFRGWLIEISGVQNCFQNFDSRRNKRFGLSPMCHRIYLYVIHVSLCELEFPFTIKKSSKWLRCSPIRDDMTDHAGPRRYECNPVFQIGTRGICNLVLKLQNPMKNCGTWW